MKNVTMGIKWDMDGWRDRWLEGWFIDWDKHIN